MAKNFEAISCILSIAKVLVASPPSFVTISSRSTRDISKVAALTTIRGDVDAAVDADNGSMLTRCRRDSLGMATNSLLRLQNVNQLLIN